MRCQAQSVQVGDSFYDPHLPGPLPVVLVPSRRRPTLPVRLIVASGDAFEYAPTEIVTIGDRPL